MLEYIMEFLRFTGIHPETFGRLSVNDPDLIYKLQNPEFKLFDDARQRILNFIHDYEDAKS